MSITYVEGGFILNGYFVSSDTKPEAVDRIAGKIARMSGHSVQSISKILTFELLELQKEWFAV
jgi:hypothetical protein